MGKNFVYEVTGDQRTATPADPGKALKILSEYAEVNLGDDGTIVSKTDLSTYRSAIQKVWLDIKPVA